MFRTKKNPFDARPTPWWWPRKLEKWIRRQIWRYQYRRAMQDLYDRGGLILEEGENIPWLKKR